MARLLERCETEEKHLIECFKKMLVIVDVVNKQKYSHSDSARAGTVNYFPRRRGNCSPTFEAGAPEARLFQNPN